MAKFPQVTFVTEVTGPVQPGRTVGIGSHFTSSINTLVATVAIVLKANTISPAGKPDGIVIKFCGTVELLVTIELITTKLVASVGVVKYPNCTVSPIVPFALTFMFIL